MLRFFIDYKIFSNPMFVHYVRSLIKKTVIDEKNAVAMISASF